MKIVVIGAGAIGSFFGGLLSDTFDVTLVGRKKHVETINKKGLRIYGKTNKIINVKAVEKIDDIDFIPDFLILSVKSYDTEKAIKQSEGIIGSDTIVVSIQNGLDNVDKIKKFVKSENIFVCITTNGVVFTKPGIVKHTGTGKTIIGSITDKNKDKLNFFSKLMNDVGLKNRIKENIDREIWVKAIVNSSINPLTAFFRCKNGYLLKNPVIEKMVDRICMESTNIAISYGLDLNYDEMLSRTKEVIMDTSENYSSMLQSIKNNQKTEIDSINGFFYSYGKKEKTDYKFNEIITNFFR